MLTDPGAVPRGNATKENIEKMGLQPGEVMKHSSCLIPLTFRHSLHSRNKDIQGGPSARGLGWVDWAAGQDGGTPKSKSAQPRSTSRWNTLYMLGDWDELDVRVQV